MQTTILPIKGQYIRAQRLSDHPLTTCLSGPKSAYEEDHSTLRPHPPPLPSTLPNALHQL